MKLFEPRGGRPGARRAQHFPGRVAVDAYGNGGFRFAGMSHRGSILCLPSGVHGWSVATAAEIDAEALAATLAEAGAFDFLVVGTGGDLVPLAPAASAALRGAGLRHEVMPTGSAIRMFNILLGENRKVAAALIAVD